MSRKRRLDAVDIILIICAVLPFAAAIALTAMFTPESEGINITGALVYCTAHLPFMDIPISETQVNSWAVVISIFFLCLFLTRKMDPEKPSARQHLAEWIVEQTEKLVVTNMGEYFLGFAPFICAVLGLSAFSSLSSLCGLFPPTSDINTTGGWAILVFILITYYKFKCGPVHYLKSYCDPVPFLLPLNIISEVATPVSMALRHFGNVLSGTVISVLVASALQGASKMVFGWLPGFLGKIPFLQVGLPAVLSIYFDVFSGCLQAFIFAMLTMLYVGGAFPMEDYFERKKKRSKANKTVV